MKKINKITVFLFLLFNSLSYSQQGMVTVSLEDREDETYKYRPKKYFKYFNGTFNKFLGTWVYSQGNQYFKITFFKTERIADWTSDRQQEDIVQSNYEYRLNGNIVFESYTSNLSFVNSHILYEPNVLGFGYGEPSLTSCSKARYGKLTITYSLNSNNQPILNWNRVDEVLREIPV